MIAASTSDVRHKEAAILRDNRPRQGFAPVSLQLRLSRGKLLRQRQQPI